MWPDAGPWPTPNGSEAQWQDTTANMTAPAARGMGEAQLTLDPHRPGFTRVVSYLQWCTHNAEHDNSAEAPARPEEEPLLSLMQRMKLF